MTSHRLRLVGVCVALSVVVSGCSRPQDKVLETATIRTAPPATEPPPTIATTPPEPTTTTPIATSTSVGPTTVMNDSEAIRTAAEKFFVAETEQQFSSLDALRLKPLATPDFYAFVEQGFAETKAAGVYYRPGAVNEHSFHRITKVSSVEATIIQCDRNDGYTWDSNRTADTSDDVRSGGKPVTFESLITLKKVGGIWLVADRNENDSEFC
jgi:hypothetical protein